MKNLGVVLCVMALAGSAFATTFTFTSNDGIGDPDDVMDLAHVRAYAWSVDTSALPVQERIVSATLTFNDIYDSTTEPYNVIHVTVLNGLPVGGTAVGTDLVQFVDNEASYADFFAGMGTAVGDIENIPTYGYPLPDISISFGDAALDALALALQSQNGAFWLGLDPDCYFLNRGVTLTIETAPAPVPEPATLSLLGLGLLGLAGLRKRGRK